MSARRQLLTVFLSVLVSICVYPGRDWLSSGLPRARPSALFAFSAPRSFRSSSASHPAFRTGAERCQEEPLPSWIRCQQLRAIRPKIVEALRRDRFSCTAPGTSVTRRPLKADSEPLCSQSSQGCLLLEKLNRCRSLLNVDLEWGERYWFVQFHLW